MAFCTDFKTALVKLSMVTAGLGLLALSACNSGRASKTAKETSGAKANSAVTAQGGSGPGINLNCVMDHIQNPPENFHYSYNKESSNPVLEEADITPQTIDGSFKNNSASSSFHGVRSDQESWRSALSGLMGIGGMASAVAIINHNSATVREGQEKVNGYDAIKYSIDTARATPAESGLYKTVLGTDGFEKGTAWVTMEGCPVKLVLDSELHFKDGSVDKIRYQEAMIRK